MEDINRIPLVKNIIQENKSNRESNDEDFESKPHLRDYYKNLDSPEVQNEFEQLLFPLEKMGYKQKIIFRSFVVYRYKDVSEAIEILSKTNNIWNHKFIDGFKGKCFVCDDLEKYHKNLNLNEGFEIRQDTLRPINIGSEKISEALKRVRSSNINFNSNNSNENLIHFESSDICPICILELEKSNEIKLNCNHKFCRDCIISYLDEEIKNSRVEQIKCPEKKCMRAENPSNVFVFSDDLIKSLVSTQTYEKYLDFKQKLLIEKDKNLTFCPIPNCKGFARLNQLRENKNNEIIQEKFQDDENEKLLVKNSDSNVILNVSNEGDNVKLTCNKNHDFCFKCKSIWKNNHNCEKDSDFIKYSNENTDKLKKCPRCKIWIEKNRGCNHMTCFVCKYEFCWLCMDECLPNHYNIPDTPCFRKQFPPEEMDPQMRDALEQLSNSSSFFFFFNLTFFLIGFFHNLYFNQNQNENEENNENNNNNQVRNKCGFFTLIFMILVFFWFLMLFINGVLLGTMIKCLSSLSPNNITNQVVYNRIKSSFGSLIFTYMLLWIIFFLPGLIISTFWLLLSISYLILVLITR